MDDTQKQSSKTMDSASVQDPEIPCGYCRKMDTINVNEDNSGNTMIRWYLQAIKPMGPAAADVPVIPCANKLACVRVSDNYAFKAPVSNTDLDRKSASAAESDSNASGNFSPEKYLTNLANFLYALCLTTPYTEYLDMTYYDPFLEIYYKILTAKDLDEQSFLHINNKIIYLGTKGLLTDKILIDVENTFKKRGYAFVKNSDVDHQSTGLLKYWYSAGNKSYAKEYWELIDNMKLLQKDKNIPIELFAKLMEPIAKDDFMQSQWDIIQCLEFTKVTAALAIIREKWKLSEVYSAKHTKLMDLVLSLTAEKRKSDKILKDYPNKILDGLKFWPNGDMYYYGVLGYLPSEDANRDLTGPQVCTSDHATPVCEMCGLQNSWLKTFRKKGIIIKEADSHNNKHIWHNEVSYFK